MKYFLLFCFFALTLSSSAQEFLKKEFHANGKLSLSVCRVGGDIHYLSFHKNGRLSEKGIYRNGKRHGTWLRCNERGETITHGSYQEDRLVGRWSYALCNGSTARVDFRNGSVDSGILRNSNGAIIAQR